jgi:sugar/nucleoside kinase (ribokinase family)
MHILVIGNTTADTFVFTEYGLKPGEKVEASTIAEYPGGQAANTAWALGALGLDVQFVGAFGDDEAGEHSVRALRDVGVSLKGSVTVEGCPSHRGLVIVDGSTGERSIAMHRDPRLRLCTRFADAWVRRAQLVYIDGHESQASIVAARQAAEFGVPVVSDAETPNAACPSLLQYVSCLIAPLSTITMLGRSPKIEEAIATVTCEEGPSTVIATDGERGSIGARRGKELVYTAAYPCSATDTTGAGDAFHAGYIAAALAGLSFDAALSFASELAATTCEVAGPRASLTSVARFRDRLTMPRIRSRPARGTLV